MSRSAAGTPVDSSVQVRRPRWLERCARRALVASLERIEHGCIELQDGTSCRQFGTAEPHDGLRARMVVRDPGFYRSVVLGGTVGAADAWMRDHWRCADPVSLVRILLRNRGVLDSMERGWARLSGPLLRWIHARRHNSRSGARDNIAAHYDLGNDFFALFLDDTLTYSCGVFEQPTCTLREASVAKLERLCRKLELGPGDRVVEIGSGWGSFALHAAGRHGCRVTTTTISRAQYELARRRVHQAGLGDRVEVLLRDYRDLEGRYDKLVSIEMIEAVGHQYFETFFRTCGRLLEPRGRAALQAITIADRHYERARREVDFIKHFVFPGCCIPSTTALLQAATRGSDLRLIDLEDLTPHYAETLRRWRARFLEHKPEARSLGCPERLLRMWDYYLAYCEGGFREHFTGLVQMVFARSGWRRAFPDCPEKRTRP